MNAAGTKRERRVANLDLHELEPAAKNSRIEVVPSNSQEVNDSIQTEPMDTVPRERSLSDRQIVSVLPGGSRIEAMQCFGDLLQPMTIPRNLFPSPPQPVKLKITTDKGTADYSLCGMTVDEFRHILEAIDPSEAEQLEYPFNLENVNAVISVLRDVLASSNPTVLCLDSKNAQYPRLEFLVHANTSEERQLIEGLLKTLTSIEGELARSLNISPMIQ